MKRILVTRICQFCWNPFKARKETLKTKNRGLFCSIGCRNRAITCQDAKLDEAIRAYLNSNKSLAEIGRQYGHSHAWLQCAFRRRGIKVRPESPLKGRIFSAKHRENGFAAIRIFGRLFVRSNRCLSALIVLGLPNSTYSFTKGTSRNWSAHCGEDCVMPVRVEWWLVQALGPDGSGTIDVLVPEGYLTSSGLPIKKRLDADCIPDVLRNPTLIMEGLERPGFDSAFCYYAKPSYRWNGSREVPPPKKKVFVVYINQSEEKGAYVVLDWEWVPEHSSKAGFPQCYSEARQTWAAN